MLNIYVKNNLRPSIYQNEGAVIRIVWNVASPIQHINDGNIVWIGVLPC